MSKAPTRSADSGTTHQLVISRWCPALMAFGFAPLLILFFLDLWHQPEYQFFPYAIAAAVYFARTRIREVPQPLESGHPALTLALVAASFAGLTLGLAIWSPWLGAVSALVAAVAWTWWRGGCLMLRALVPTFVMLAVIVPPPARSGNPAGHFPSHGGDDPQQSRLAPPRGHPLCGRSRDRSADTKTAG